MPIFVVPGSHIFQYRSWVIRLIFWYLSLDCLSELVEDSCEVVGFYLFSTLKNHINSHYLLQHGFLATDSEMNNSVQYVYRGVFSGDLPIQKREWQDWVKGDMNAQCNCSWDFRQSWRCSGPQVPFRVVPYWDRGLSIYIPELASHWPQPAPWEWTKIEKNSSLQLRAISNEEPRYKKLENGNHRNCEKGGLAVKRGYEWSFTQFTWSLNHCMIFSLVYNLILIFYLFH